MDVFNMVVLCPKCNKFIPIDLIRISIPKSIKNKLKEQQIPFGNEFCFKGESQCKCGKKIKATFVYE